MRDPNRIKPTLNKLAELWESAPDLRLGQIFEIVRHGYPDLFNIEDDELIDAVENVLTSIKYNEPKL